MAAPKNREEIHDQRQRQALADLAALQHQGDAVNSAGGSLDASVARMKSLQDAQPSRFQGGSAAWMIYVLVFALLSPVIGYFLYAAIWH